MFNRNKKAAEPKRKHDLSQVNKFTTNSENNIVFIGKQKKIVCKISPYES